MQNTKYFCAMFIAVAIMFFMACDDDSTNPEDVFTPLGMVLIETADISFDMGSDAGLFSDEQPVHTVTFSASFWIDTTEVTQADYDSLMSEAYTDYGTPEWHDTYGLGDNYPAYAVSWDDAILYCNARSVRDGLDTVYTYTSITGTPGNMCELEGVEADSTANGYRLPTEAQWEYACRGGVDNDFFWGQDFDPYPSTADDTTEVDSYAYWYANAWNYGSEDDEFGTHEVASKLANPYGLYDMAGNLYEWCYDFYGEYSSDAVTDPSGPETGDYHCMRGGSWGSHCLHLRSANRTLYVPDYQYNFIGFRVVLPEQE